METGDRINNGADDDGSGTVAVMEMAKVFCRSKERRKWSTKKYFVYDGNG